MRLGKIAFGNAVLMWNAVWIVKLTLKESSQLNFNFFFAQSINKVFKNWTLVFERPCRRKSKRKNKWTFESTSRAACTWLLLSELTPSLTRLRDTLEAVELIELTESWLPLRSRDILRLVFIKVRDCGLGVDADMLLVTLPDVSRVTLWMGANNPNMGRHSKYL